MTAENFVRHIPAIASLLDDANHVDVKTIDTDISLRCFMANMFSYMPAWMKALYGIRWGFVRLLGMKQEGMPHSLTVNPDDISFQPGDSAAFFEVVAAKEESYYLSAASERHLTAHLGVAIEPLDNGLRRFHVVTIVHYHHWTGPVYFNAIRPFHHIVVNQMMKAGVRGPNFAPATV